MNEREMNDFMQAYDSLNQALFRHCYFRVYDRERAKELVHDTYTRTWEYIANGNKVENLRAFLYRVLNNLIINESKKKKPLHLEDLQASGFDPGKDPRENIDIAIEASRVRKILELLDEKDRNLIVMRYVDDLGPKDIALALNESENVISVRLHRAMKEFRKVLDEQL